MKYEVEMLETTEMINKWGCKIVTIKCVVGSYDVTKKIYNAGEYNEYSTYKIVCARGDGRNYRLEIEPVLTSDEDYIDRFEIPATMLDRLDYKDGAYRVYKEAIGVAQALTEAFRGTRA